MENFIYVFDSAARDMLLQAGFLLLKEDEQNSVYVFSNDSTLKFSETLSDHSHVLSDNLTF